MGQVFVRASKRARAYTRQQRAVRISATVNKRLKKVAKKTIPGFPYNNLKPNKRYNDLLKLQARLAAMASGRRY